MELRLKRPIEELIPALIEWNNEDLLTEVRRLMKSYDGKVYVGNSAMREMKEDKAKINKFVKALTDGRISIRRIYEAPYLKFKKQVDEVISEADRVAEQIDRQIEETEREEKARKYDELKAYWERCSAELLQVVPYEKIHKEKWLNATVSVRNAMLEINDAINNIRTNRMTIQAMKNITDEEKERILTLYFRTLDFGEAIRQNEAYKEEKTRVETLTKNNIKTKEKETEEIKSDTEKQYQISFSVIGTEREITALSGFLKNNNYNYKKL